MGAAAISCDSWSVCEDLEQVKWMWSSMRKSARGAKEAENSSVVPLFWPNYTGRVLRPVSTGTRRDSQASRRTKCCELDSYSATHLCWVLDSVSPTHSRLSLGKYY